MKKKKPNYFVILQLLFLWCAIRTEQLDPEVFKNALDAKKTMKV